MEATYWGLFISGYFRLVSSLLGVWSGVWMCLGPTLVIPLPRSNLELGYCGILSPPQRNNQGLAETRPVKGRT